MIDIFILSDKVKTYFKSYEFLNRHQLECCVEKYSGGFGC